MALSPRLEVRQSQSLTLTPQLMQSIRLLQLSHLELNAFVEASTSLSDVARKLPGWLWSDAVYGALVTRVSQAAAGEMTVLVDR